MKLSSKDILILLGIAVAVIITLTTLVYTDQKTIKKAELPGSGKTALHQFAKELFNRAVPKSGL